METSRSPLRIRLFGPFEITCGDRPLPRFRSRKGQWLLALLVLREGREVDRGWLAGTLWPDSPEDLARASLRRSLNDLRHVLGEDAARLYSPTFSTLTFDSDGVDIDVHAFNRAVSRNDEDALDLAVSLYGGPLLEGCDEEWIFPERQSCEEAFLKAAESYAILVREAGNATAALRVLRRAIAVNPLRESGQRLLMETLADIGSLTEAREAYRSLRERLHRERHGEPDPETTRLYERLRRDPRSVEKADAHTPLLPEKTPRRFASHFHRPWTPLIGRERELREVIELLENARLVTLVGPGGVGKTRLAFRVGETIDERCPDSVVFVDLSPLSDPDTVSREVAGAFGIRETPGNEPLPSRLGPLLEELSPSSLLLVLDNCEHLIHACASLAETILTGTTRLRLLATSRETLRLPGENVVSVGPLSLPDTDSCADLEQLLRSDAARLLLERVQKVHPAFDPRGAIEPLSRICRQLDGLPLALELAAARAHALSLEQISARLADTTDLLNRGSRTAPPRQKTLRATLDWSWSLLDEKERRLFRRLSVFTGVWTLDAAEMVGSGSGIEDREVTDLLAALVEKSLVSYHREERRYRLLEPVRQYAWERLAESAEGEAVRDRHIDFHLREASPADPGNLLTALDWSEVRKRWKAGMALATRLAEEVWWPRGMIAYGLERFLRFLPHAPSLEERNPEERSTLERFYDCTALFAHFQGDFSLSRELYERQLEISRKWDDPAVIASALYGMGWLLGTMGEIASSRECLEESLRRYRVMEDGWGCAISGFGLGHAYLNEHRYGPARACLEEALCFYEKSCVPARVWGTREALACVDLLEGDDASARVLFPEILSRRWAERDYWNLPISFLWLAELAAHQGRWERAMRLLGAAERWGKAFGAPLVHSLPRNEKQLRERAAPLLEQRSVNRWKAGGREMSLEEAVAYAMSGHGKTSG